jgi:hypothetical protein
MRCPRIRRPAIVVLAAALWCPSVGASDGDPRPRKAAAGTAAKKRHRPEVKPESTASWQARHGMFFRRNWGVEIVGVRRISSGLMLRFDYRVLDATRAVALNDRKARPYLIDEITSTALAVPAMEKVGELRQVAPYQSNRTYFMIFGNPGGLVKHGGRVTLVMGNLRAEGLVVE